MVNPALGLVALIGLTAIAMLAASPAPGRAGPAAPKKFRPVKVETGLVKLRWRDRATNESRYEVRRRQVAPKRRRSRRRRLRRNRRRFSDRKVRPGRTYLYRVRACNRRGCSRWSRRIRVTVPGATSSPAACTVFPSDNPWNRDISNDPVDPNSDDYVAQINADGADFLHADFGTDFGIPYVEVPAGQRKVPIRFTAYADESDPGPYPIPPDAPVEEGGDRHVIAVDRADCKLYELYAARFTDPGWEAESGAVFNLRSNALRPNGWTSADAAGLPIFAGLARYDEAARGAIRHALRFTVEETQRGYIHPATHFASDSDNPDRPPMGLRLRLKASYDLSGFHGQARVVLEALRRYGMFVADNGGNWFISGAPDSRWSNEDLDQLKSVPGTAFEVVRSGPIRR